VQTNKAEAARASEELRRVEIATQKSDLAYQNDFGASRSTFSVGG
jgi:hypothetical protein